MIVTELIDDSAGCIVEECLAVAVHLLVGIGSSIASLDVEGVEIESGGGVCDDLLPVAQGVVASGTVRVKDWVLFAEDRLAVEIDCFVVLFCAVGLVSGSLELRGIVLALLCRLLACIASL